LKLGGQPPNASSTVFPKRSGSDLPGQVSPIVVVLVSVGVFAFLANVELAGGNLTGVIHSAKVSNFIAKTV